MSLYTYLYDLTDYGNSITSNRQSEKKRGEKLYICPYIMDFLAMHFKVYGSKTRLLKLDIDILTATENLEKLYGIRMIQIMNNK